MKRKLTDEQYAALKELESLIGDPLNALDVYAPFKRFEEYFTLVVYDNLHVKIQRQHGQLIFQQIMACRVLLPKCQFGTRANKLQATKDFLDAFATILGGIDFIAMHDVGVSIGQSTELVMIIKEIQRQMGGFRKYLENEEGIHQNPQPTGEGSE